MLFAAVNLMWIVYMLAAVVAFFAVKELFRKDERIEDKRRHAIEIAQELSKEGLEHIPALLTDYAVGDYSGMFNRVRSWYDFLRDDDNRRAFFLKFLRRQLEQAMADESRRGEILKAVEQWQALDDAKLAKQRETIKAKLTAEAAALTEGATANA